MLERELNYKSEKRLFKERATKERLAAFRKRTVDMVYLTLTLTLTLTLSVDVVHL